jgi:glycosyltransferase involved in cell wall biosynthesis
MTPNNRLGDAEMLVTSLRRMQQLVICLSHSWGGLEQVAAGDALDLGKLGLSVRVLCLQGSPIHESLAHNKDVSVIPLGFQPRDFMDFGLRAELLRLIGDGVNLIHTHQTSLLGSIVPGLWSQREVGLLASRHIMSGHDKNNFFHRAIYARVDYLIVMSQTLKENVLATHPVREKKVKVVNLGLDFERFDPDKVNAEEQRARWGADADTIVIGVVGRIDPAKGQGTFIKAAAGLMKGLRGGEKLKFVIVGEETLGSTGGHLGELKKMVSQFGMDPHVVFAGYQENIPEVMRAFDIFVMPSRQEAFGLVAIEAMAMECPIVISSGGSADEIVGDAEFGLTVRPDDAFDLQRQLRHLLDSPIERMEMGERARRHVASHYDRRIRIIKSLEICERTLKRRGDRVK